MMIKPYQLTQKQFDALSAIFHTYHGHADSTIISMSSVELKDLEKASEFEDFDDLEFHQLLVQYQEALAHQQEAKFDEFFSIVPNEDDIPKFWISNTGCFVYFDKMDKWLSTHPDFSRAEKLSKNFIREHNDVGYEEMIRPLSEEDILAMMQPFPDRIEAMQDLNTAAYRGFIEDYQNFIEDSQDLNATVHEDDPQNLSTPLHEDAIPQFWTTWIDDLSKEHEFLYFDPIDQIIHVTTDFSKAEALSKNFIQEHSEIDCKREIRPLHEEEILLIIKQMPEVIKACQALSLPISNPKEEAIDNHLSPQKLPRQYQNMW